MNDNDRITLEVVRAELNGKLDLLLERSTEAKKDLDDHETRIRSVERWKYTVPASLLMAAAAGIGWMITYAR